MGETDPKCSEIMRTETHLRAPTGEGTVYITASGERWRTDGYGNVVGPGNAYGRIVGIGKFAAHVVRG